MVSLALLSGNLFYRWRHLKLKDQVEADRISHSLFDMNERFTTLFDATSDVVLILDPALTILYANRVARERANALAHSQMPDTLHDLLAPHTERARVWADRVQQVITPIQSRTLTISTPWWTAIAAANL